MRTLAIAFAFAIVTLPTSAPAAIVITLSGTPLQAGSPSQRISVYLHSDAGTIENVVGMDLYAFIGDGSADQDLPRFYSVGDAATREAVALRDGDGGESFLWDQFPSGSNVSGFAPLANEYESAVGILAEDPFETVSIGATGTLVAQFLLDTSQYAGGTFDFTVTTNASHSSNLYTFDGEDSYAVIPFSGTLTLTAVPEPTSFAAAGLLTAAAWGFRRLRRRSPGMTHQRHRPSS